MRNFWHIFPSLVPVKNFEHIFRVCTRAEFRPHLSICGPGQSLEGQTMACHGWLWSLGPLSQIRCLLFLSISTIKGFWSPILGFKVPGSVVHIVSTWSWSLKYIVLVQGFMIQIPDNLMLDFHPSKFNNFVQGHRWPAMKDLGWLQSHGSLSLPSTSSSSPPTPSPSLLPLNWGPASPAGEIWTPFYIEQTFNRCILLILLTGVWTMAVLSSLRDLVVVSILQLLSKSARFLQGEILSRNSSIFLSKYWCENRYGFNSSLLFSACRFDLAATSLKGLCGAVGCYNLFIEIHI